MKRKNLFVLAMVFGILLTACNDVVVEPEGPSKTTTLKGGIPLKAKYYTEAQKAALLNWSGGWEFLPSEEQLKLSNLMPDGIIKNDTSYEVTISGTLLGNQMDAFQFVFTVPGIYDTDAWIDLSYHPSDSKTIPLGEFTITGTLKTKGILFTSGTGKPQDPYIDTFVENYKHSGMLAFTNAVDTVENDHNRTMATLTNVTITITELQ